jgi:MFS family permease
MRRVLRHREFRLLWLSQAVSTIGDRIVIVVLALYVNRIGTPTDVGLVLAAHAIPFLALLLLGGVWADRLPRHLVMVSTDLIRGVLHALLAVLVLTGRPAVVVIAVIEALFGAAEAFFRPAYSGLVPQTVPDELIPEAQAVTQLTSNLSGFLGPALGSLLFLAFGGGGAFAVDAVSFFCSAALLVRVRPRERGERSPREPILRELAGGWRELRARPWAGIIIASACWSLLVLFGPYQALGPAVADEVYGQAAVFGLMSAAFGVGSVVGSVVAVRWQPERRMLIISLVFLPWALSYLGFALGVPYVPLMALALLSGFGIGLFGVWWESALATEIPPAALSRVSAFDWMGSLGLLPVAYLLAGPVAAAVGPRQTLIGGAILVTLLQLVVIAARPIREWRPQPNSGTPDSVVEASA